MDRLIWILLFLYLALFPFGQLVRLPIIPFGLQEIRVYLTDVIVGLAGIGWLIWWIPQKRKKYPPFLKELSLFGTAILFSFLLAIHAFQLNEILISASYLARVFAYGLFYFAVWDLVFRNNASQRFILSSLVVSGTAFTVLGWIQYFLFPDIRPFTVWGWDEHYTRLVGTFLDPGFTAIIVVFLLLLAGSSLVAEPRGSAHKSGLLILCFFSFLTLLLTYSRAGYVAFIVGMGTIAILQKKIFVFVFSFLFLVSGILLLQHLPGPESEGTKLERTTSTLKRLESWERALQLWQTSPVFGVGFNFYAAASYDYRYALEKSDFVAPDPEIPEHGRTGSDSSLLFVLSTTGVVGFLLFAHLVLKIIATSLKINSGASITLLSSLIALAVHSLFLNSIFYAPVMGWLAILLALATVRIKGSK